MLNKKYFIKYLVSRNYQNSQDAYNELSKIIDVEKQTRESVKNFTFEYNPFLIIKDEFFTDDDYKLFDKYL